ncbi:MAG: hypothetical protein LBT42_01770 [Tannerella sp.]|nr:hypothetical protein [Tannerella sp.]
MSPLRSFVAPVDMTEASCPSLRGTKQSGALYISWIASFLAMTASADGKRRRFPSSFFLFAKLV